jgi:hypothetical protein
VEGVVEEVKGVTSTKGGELVSYLLESIVGKPSHTAPHVSHTFALKFHLKTLHSMVQLIDQLYV